MLAGTKSHGREGADSRFAWFATSLTHPGPLRTNLPRIGRLTASSGGPDQDVGELLLTACRQMPVELPASRGRQGLYDLGR